MDTYYPGPSQANNVNLPESQDSLLVHCCKQMCDRFARYSPRRVFAKQFRLKDVDDPLAYVGDTQPSWNIVPGKPCLVLRTEPTWEPGFAYLSWGFLPHWVNDTKAAALSINARAETAPVNPYFRSSLVYKRCLVAADGFYEWRERGRRKQPYFVQMADGSPFALAGLWDQCGRGASAVASFTILTTEANELMAPIHSRMPVIVSPENYELWLDPEITSVGKILHIFRPYRASQMICYRVSDKVNSPENDGPELIQPAVKKG